MDPDSSIRNQSSQCRDENLGGLLLLDRGDHPVAHRRQILDDVEPGLLGPPGAEFAQVRREFLKRGPQERVIGRDS
jgi:hypothetical protein